MLLIINNTYTYSIVRIYLTAPIKKGQMTLKSWCKTDILKKKSNKMDGKL